MRRFMAAIEDSQKVKSNHLTKYTHFEDFYLEYVLAPFHGYKGDGMQWLILRDITNQKK